MIQLNRRTPRFVPSVADMVLACLSLVATPDDAAGGWMAWKQVLIITQHRLTVSERERESAQRKKVQHICIKAIHQLTGYTSNNSNA